MAADDRGLRLSRRGLLRGDLGGTKLLARGRAQDGAGAWRGLSVGFAAVLLMLAARVYLGRFAQLFDDRGGAIFSGVAYTDAHVTLTGMLVVAGALVVGAAMALVNAVSAPRLRWLIAAVVPAAVCYGVVTIVSWYVSSFIVKPNELVRETPYIAHNIDFTRQAYALNRIEQQAFPADVGLDAVDPARNQATLQNIRLWDWRALQDTLRQIQEIRTYYDFQDIDIDRYEVGGAMRQMMVAARELNIDKLPESSRNWINEKLIYTHGYGVTMNPVNGFTPEGLPTLVLGNMPVQSTLPGITVTRPEIYFGQLTNSDVYVKTGQKEFNYPQGEANNLTSYEGTGGIVIANPIRKLLLAINQGDVAKLPFSDDVTSASRLLMRRNIRDRVQVLAPFLTFDPDPYMVVGDDGRLSWMIDAFTTSDSFPYARHYLLGSVALNYIRNSVKVVIDAYDGTTTFYVFDKEDPVVAAYRRIFPTLFKDASAMPPALRKHVRYPELLLKTAGGGVRAVSHDRAGGVLQPGRPVECGERSRPEPATGAGRAANGAELRADDAAGRDQDRVHGDPAVYAGEPQQPHRLDCGPKRRPELRFGARLQLSEDPSRGRPPAGRGAHRSERPAVRAAVSLESAGIARTARHADRHSDRPRAAVRRTDLPAGRAQPDARAPARRARAAGSTGVRPDL